MLPHLSAFIQILHEAIQGKGPFRARGVVSRPWVFVSGNVIRQDILWHCWPTLRAPGLILRKRSPLWIKAINKIVVLVLLFQSSRLPAHPAAVKDNSLVVAGVGGLLHPAAVVLKLSGLRQLTNTMLWLRHWTLIRLVILSYRAHSLYRNVCVRAGRPAAP